MKSNTSALAWLTKLIKDDWCSLIKGTSDKRLKHVESNVFSLRELNEQINEIGEATQTKSSEQLQVQALADKAKQINQQKKQLQARQAMAKAQEKMREANKAVVA